MAEAITIKKYENRRLYDPVSKGYVNLEQVAEYIRAGHEVRIVDAKSGDDLTQQTLAQLILESRGAAKLLPVSLLTRLVRLGDDALGDFFGRYITWSLDMYLAARDSTAAARAANPLLGAPLEAMRNAASSWFGVMRDAAQAASGGGGARPQTAKPSSPGSASEPDVAEPSGEPDAEPAPAPSPVRASRRSKKATGGTSIQALQAQLAALARRIEELDGPADADDEDDPDDEA